MAAIRSLGFIGLGVMGRPMARNLVAGGFEVTVHSRSRGPVDELVAAGARRAGSPAECAAGRDLVILMLPDSPDSELVMLGPRGVLEAGRPAPLVCDMSSIRPGVSRRIAAACAARSVAFVDAPVSGGEPAAITGDLAIMAGGSEDAFERLAPVFGILGKSAVRCGDVGAGGAVKLANQMIVAANIRAVGEALLFAVRSGLDPRVVVDAIRGGLAGERGARSQGAQDDRRRLETGVPPRAAPEGSRQRPRGRRRVRRPGADDGLGARSGEGARRRRARR